MSIKQVSTEETVIGIVGAGTMGSGIALAALYKGFNVILQDAFPGALENAQEYLKKFLDKKDLSENFKLVRFTKELDDLAPATVVIEAIIEDMAIKQELFSKLDKISPDAILATNTSTLPVTAIASAVGDPSSVVGMHFFNPAPILPLVEVVRAAQTRDDVLQFAVWLAEALDKTPVITGDTPGFIVNRVARPFYGEALRLLGEGVAGIEEIDQLIEKGAGFRMGPFRLMDLIGIDINATAMKSMYEQTFGEPRYRPHWIQMQKMQAGTLGRKSGRGFYDYESEKSEKQANRDGKVTSESLDILVYDLNEAHPLLQRLRSAGHRLHEKPPQKQKVDAALILSESKEAIEDQMRMLVEGKQNDLTILAPGIALTHAELGTWLQGHAAWVFSYDSMFIEGSEQITLCFSSAADAGQLETVSALFSSCGLQPVWVKDAPALVLPRIVTMLINEAAFAVQDRVADAETIDRAMILGVNYPRGLLEWGAELGWQRVLAVLEHLYFEYREERYRPCRLIRQWAREEAART